MIILKQGLGYRYVSVVDLHRALGVTGTTAGDWIRKRVSEMDARRGVDYRNSMRNLVGSNLHLGPAFAQELAMWERSATSRAVAKSINRQMRPQLEAARPIEPKEIVAPITTTQAVIEGLNDPAILRAVLFHFIQQQDNRRQ